jgi:hypothetical protein
MICEDVVVVSLVTILFTHFCLFVHVQAYMFVLPQNNPGRHVPSLKEKNTGSIGSMLWQFRIGWVEFLFPTVFIIYFGLG